MQRRFPRQLDVGQDTSLIYEINASVLVKKLRKRCRAPRALTLSLAYHAPSNSNRFIY
jgi:hypothetical protein